MLQIAARHRRCTPFALPSVRQVYSSPRRIPTEDLDVASLVEAFTHEMPREAELCLLRHPVAFFRRPVVPCTKYAKHRGANTGRHAQTKHMGGTRMILERHFGPVARAHAHESPRPLW